MPTELPPIGIDGVVVLRLDVHGDVRGDFVETYRRSWFPGAPEMVQANRAARRAGTVVGLHFHHHQADWWTVHAGHARVVLHDLRVGSPTEGATATIDVGEVAGGAHNHLGVYIPPGVGHGFAAVTDVTVSYLVDGEYDPDDELEVAWDDPALVDAWDVHEPVLSARDRGAPRIAELADDRRPRHHPGRR